MTENTIELNFIDDNPDYYLIGDQIWYSSLFTHHTMSAIERDESGSPRHVLDLSKLQGSSAEVDSLIQCGWEQAVFIGKLMTSGANDEQVLIKKRQEASRPYKSQELIAQLASKHVGFHTSLFVLRPIYGYVGEKSSDEEKAVHGPAQIVAGMHSNGHRSLRVIPFDLEEHYYDEQYGEREDTAGFSEDTWQAINNFHRLLYDQASNEIAAKRLGEELVV